MRSHFAKNIIYSSGSTALVQILALAATPLLAKYYSTEDFGKFSLYMAFVNILIVAAFLRLDTAIIQTKDARDVSGIIWLCLILLTIFSVGFLIALPIILNGISTMETFFSITGFIFLAIFQILLTIGIRNSDFKHSSIAKSYRSITQTVIQTVLPYFGKDGAISLFAGYAVGQILGVAFLIFRYRFNLEVPLFSKMSRLLRENKELMTTAAPAAIISAVGLNIPTLIISTSLSSSEAGIYNMAMRFIGAPNILISQTIGQVFSSKINNEIRNGNSYIDTVKRTYMLLISIVTPVTFLLMSAGPDSVELILGEKWTEVSNLIFILSPWLAFNFVSSPLSAIAVALHQHAIGLKITIFELVFRAISMILGILLGGLKIGLILFSLSGVLISLYYINWVLKVAHLDSIKFLKEILISTVLVATNVMIYHSLKNEVVVSYAICFFSLSFIAYICFIRTKSFIK